MSLQLLKEGNAEKIKEFYQKRVPKIVTDLTPRNVLKKMIEDLERENGNSKLVISRKFDELAIYFKFLNLISYSFILRTNSCILRKV